MNLTKCPNGHFYDGDRFAECPHCLQTEFQQTEPLSGPIPFGASQPVMQAEPVIRPEPMKQPTPVKQPAPSFVSPAVDEGVTIGQYQRILGVEPVVGWLVCIKGEYFGESFKLHSGKNFIGRASDMDIILGLDKSVSRNRHACVIYEPRSRVFIAQPGESRELFYLNDDVVLDNVKMKAYDVLQIGETKLMIIPCCGEQFSWDEVTDK